MDAPMAMRLIREGLRGRAGKFYRVEAVGDSAPGSIVIDILQSREKLQTVEEERAELALHLGVDVGSLPITVPDDAKERRRFVAMAFGIEALSDTDPLPW